MEDTDKMPFGKYKGMQMIDVPAYYLVWLGDNASKGLRGAFPEVFEYIKENKDAFELELKNERYGND